MHCIIITNTIRSFLVGTCQSSLANSVFQLMIKRGKKRHKTTKFTLCHCNNKNNNENDIVHISMFANCLTTLFQLHVIKFRENCTRFSVMFTSQNFTNHLNGYNNRDLVSEQIAVPGSGVKLKPVSNAIKTKWILCQLYRCP